LELSPIRSSVDSNVAALTSARARQKQKGPQLEEAGRLDRGASGTMRISPQRRMHLRAAGAVAALGGVLLIAVTVRMHAQRLVDEVTTPALGSVALLTIQSLMHVPECAADTHCRSACRMVCEEAASGTRAVRNHAATLISFGCCLSTPLIEKQVLGPSGAREVQLAEVRGRKAEKRFGSTPLADHHSLAANLRALEQDEGSQVHTTLEATQGQMDSFFSQLPYKCYLEDVSSVGD